jgi:Sulfotransferase domain
MALPTFFIIGAAKAGTTSLHFYLDQHPEIGMSTVKEPHFFAGPENGIPFPPERVTDLGAYEALFDPSFRVRGEASPSYTNAPRREGVPERIKRLVPEAKLIYLVRDPVERTLSHYRHSLASGTEQRPLEEAIADLERDDPYCYLACHSLYGRQLELYLRQFAAEDVLVLDQAQLLAERPAALRRAFSFLEVDPGFRSERFGQELWRTSERRVSPPGHHNFIARAIAPRTRWVPARARRRLRRAWEKAFWRPLEKPELTAEQRARLQEFFAPDVERLRALSGERFANWSL